MGKKKENTATKRQSQFAMIPQWVIARLKGDATAVAVYTILAGYRNYQTGYAFPSLATLADAAGKDKSWVSRTINRLVELGCISKERIGKNDRRLDPRLHQYFLPQDGCVAEPKSTEMVPFGNLDGCAHATNSSKMVAPTQQDSCVTLPLTKRRELESAPTGRERKEIDGCVPQPNEELSALPLATHTLSGNSGNSDGANGDSTPVESFKGVDGTWLLDAYDAPMVQDEEECAPAEPLPPKEILGTVAKGEVRTVREDDCFGEYHINVADTISWTPDVERRLHRLFLGVGYKLRITRITKPGQDYRKFWVEFQELPF